MKDKRTGATARNARGGSKDTAKATAKATPKNLDITDRDLPAVLSKAANDTAALAEALAGDAPAMLQPAKAKKSKAASREAGPKSPAAAMRKSGERPKRRSAEQPVRIFQIYFEAWQRDLLDPAFIPFDNSGVRSELLEFDVFERLASDPRTTGASLWGALSWRYAEKTGLSGAELLAQIEKNPGHDVYYCNPHVQNEALYHNMWLQGETAHPRFLELCQAVFKAAGLPEEELTSLQPSSVYSTANYLIGTPAFWAKYLAFIRAVLASAEKNLSPDMKALLHSTGADDRGLHGGATYVPFIVERLFSVFIRSIGRDLKGYKIDLPERDSDLNVHLKLLREMKDVAHRTKSPWLAACWVNYRLLYLSNLHGKGWCQKYLRAITPTSIKFG